MYFKVEKESTLYQKFVEITERAREAMRSLDGWLISKGGGYTGVYKDREIAYGGFNSVVFDGDKPKGWVKGAGESFRPRKNSKDYKEYLALPKVTFKEMNGLIGFKPPYFYNTDKGMASCSNYGFLNPGDEFLITMHSGILKEGYEPVEGMVEITEGEYMELKKKKNRVMKDIEQFCRKAGMTVDQFHGREMITRGLDLNWVEELPDGFSPIINGNLLLNGLKSIPEGFNPVVGWILWLNGLASIPDGFNPVIGMGVMLYGLNKFPGRIGHANIRNPPAMLEWREGKYVSVLGIFMEVLERTGKAIKGNSYDGGIVWVYGADGIFGSGPTLEKAKGDYFINLMVMDVENNEKQ